MNSVFHEAAEDISSRGCDRVTAIEIAIVIAVQSARATCFQSPANEMTGATNDHEVMKRIMQRLENL